MNDIVVRRAHLDEAPRLTELALRSKASWGYTPEFMAACRNELTLTAAKLTAWDVWIALVDGTIAGVTALRPLADSVEAELEYLFVDPCFQQRGVGAALFAQMIDACRARGVTLLSVDADPHAARIYQRFGFRTVGRSPSGSIPGRTLPRMQLRLVPSATPAR